MSISNIDNVKNLFHKAIKVHQEGNENKAKEMYEELLCIDETHGGSLCNLSIIYKNTQNYSKALTLLNRALAIDPKNITALVNFAKLYQKIDARDKAVEVLEFAIKIEHKNASLHNELAIIHESVGDFEKALHFYKNAIKLDSKFIKAYNNIGVILYKQNRYNKAIEIFKIAQKIDSSHVGTYINLGAALNRAKRYSEAKEVLEKALKLDKESCGCYVNLGNVLNKLGLHDEALVYHKKALEMEPNSSSSHANIAITYKNLTHFKKSKTTFKKAIELHPTSINAHFDLATLLLLNGEFEEGFREYEWRFKKTEMITLLQENEKILEKPKFKIFSYSVGKSLLIYGEQGFGDNIQFIRYAKLLKKDYPKMQIILQCRAELKSLFEEVSYVDKVVSRHEELPEFDYQLSLMSLPYFFETTRDTIPVKTPYLKADKKELLLDIDKAMINIALVWGGSNTNENHTHRVLSLEKFLPILNHPKIRVFSLQVGEDAKEIQKLGLNDKQIVDLSGKLTNFKTTAAAIKQLDLVISSDTSVAHLSGALNADIWTMLQKIPDWRWMMERKSSPWYPSMKLFRQKNKGEWEDVYSEVFDSLEKKFKIKIERD